MGQRRDLQLILEGILGSRNVYFQPPATIQMKYPCIVYNRSDYQSKYAGNNPYILEKAYSVMVIDRNPDSEVPDKIARLTLSSFDRGFVSDGLNHSIFTLYF